MLILPSKNNKLSAVHIIQRFPLSSNRSLKAWSAADEHILKFVNEEISEKSSISIINDRFGYLSVSLNKYKPNIISDFKSQEDAIESNYKLNSIDTSILRFTHLIDDDNAKYDLVTLKIPKSLDLFHLFLISAHKNSHSESKVFCGFMTKHFTKQMLEIASHYFVNVEQSLAWKKSRVIILSKPKMQLEEIIPIKTISYLNHRDEKLLFKQYFGVFSANHIDYATQFLLANLNIDESAKNILDLACGNGVIAHEIRNQSETAEIHLHDDSYLAIESARMNLSKGDNHFHYNYHLGDFKDEFFDLVVCNPPFHFEHENTIDIALQFFKGVSRILKKDGVFIIVSNLHLNYKTHLSKIYNNVEVINMNKKFEIIKCQNR